MDNSVFPDICRDFHDLNQNDNCKDFAKILDLIENFPPLECFVAKIRIWIPSRIMLLAVLIVTALEWPKSGFRWARKS